MSRKSPAKVEGTPEAKLRFHTEQMRACENSYVEHAYEVGCILIDQKANLNHGDWLEWLKDNWTLTRRSAADYISLAKLERSKVIECESIREAKKLIPKKAKSNGKRASHLEAAVKESLTTETKQAAKAHIEPKPAKIQSKPDLFADAGKMVQVEQGPVDADESAPVEAINDPALKLAAYFRQTKDVLATIEKPELDLLVTLILDAKPKLKRKFGPVNTDGYTSDFEDFWAAFPKKRRTKKQKAFTAWSKSIKRFDALKIIEAATEYAESAVGQSDYVLGPEPWLNGGCWDDDREAWKRGNSDKVAEMNSQF